MNTHTTGTRDNATTPQPPTGKQRLERNYRRSKKMSAARAKNIRWRQPVTAAIHALEAEAERKEDQAGPEKPFLEKFNQRLCTCTANALYRRNNGGRECSLITAAVCNHRLCNVCNMIRSNKLRRKWRGFLQDATMDVPVRKAQKAFWDEKDLHRGQPKLKVDLETGELIEDLQPSKTSLYTSGAMIASRFDLMHLTLTVPHTDGKWRGLEYYAAELLQAFNEMRKAKWWVQNIFGGEYTVETTYSQKGGLHVHIHALLFVDKYLRGSRNFLYQKIMVRWNALTVDPDNTRSPYLQPATCPEDAARLAGFRKSFAKMPEDDFNNLLLEMDWRGSSMVGLKSLYHEVSATDAAKYPPKSIFEENGKYYHYCRPGNVQSMLKGVVECLKYHFEPCALEDENGDLNIDLLKKVLPNIHGKRLYGKFGGFYGVKSLNILEDDLTPLDMLQDAGEAASDAAFDPKSGHEAAPGTFYYAIADSKHVVFDADKPLAYLQTSKIKMHIDAGADGGGMMQAVKAFTSYCYQQKK